MSHIPGNSFDLAEYHSVKHHGFAGGCNLADLAQVQQHLNQFLTGSGDLDLLDGLDWFQLAVTGKVMPFILPQFSRRLYLSKMEELKLLYERDPLQIVCRWSNMSGFWAAVRAATAQIDQNTGRVGERVIERNLCAYVITDDPSHCGYDDHHYRTHMSAVLGTDNTPSGLFGDHKLGTDVPVKTEAPRYRIRRVTSIQMTRMFGREYCKSSECQTGIPWHLVCIDPPHAPREQVYLREQITVVYYNPAVLRPITFVSDAKAYGVAEQLRMDPIRRDMACERAMYRGDQAYLAPSAVLAYAAFVVYTPWGDSVCHHTETVREYAQKGYEICYSVDQQHPELLYAHSDYQQDLRHRVIHNVSI